MRYGTPSISTNIFPLTLLIGRLLELVLYRCMYAFHALFWEIAEHTCIMIVLVHCSQSAILCKHVCDPMHFQLLRAYYNWCYTFPDLAMGFKTRRTTMQEGHQCTMCPSPGMSWPRQSTLVSWHPVLSWGSREVEDGGGYWSAQFRTFSTLSL